MAKSDTQSKKYDETVEDDSFFTPDQIIQIVKVLKSNYTHLLWFKLLYTFGMNLKDIVNLKVGAIDFQRSKIKILGGEKSLSRSLDIPFSILCDFRIFCHQKTSDDFVFQGRSGKLHTRTIQKALEKIENKIGLSVSVPKIRRSIAVHLRQNGWSQVEIGLFLGHVNTRSTRNLFGQIRSFPKGDLVSIEQLLK
ncbi:MAG TPA: tyrosine-type recombinase/integrase [Leptospiraceae bacterium]|nr:tyrosine-type recombinase/integrase [Leptospiraceae bacterium]HMW04914.1 tyrosine-type recombinase/integrase [Leptospiraceae bacterium]HMX33963.1 tyrosine-type recombinase/integrase [Leptospiraceae bacterium]HMY30865.1 tyrosine-type recombinase/integrase [Leptospiraceae bacterium]HMZ62669.1 tyrosine-type recombinase/integrase [Leptospiraceae bacterium]